MRAFLLQSSFNRGELAPELALRDDIDAWKAGAQQLTNVLSIPQGGVQRRPATQWFATLAGKARLAPFEFNVDQSFIVALSNLKAEVFDGGNIVATVVTPYTLAQLFDVNFPVRWAQQADTMILVHGEHAPRKLVRYNALSGTAGVNPFATINGNPTVTVTDTAHGLITGRTVVFVGATDTNGILAATLNRAQGFVVTVTGENTFTFVSPTAASATGAGGGAVVTWTSAQFWALETIAFTNVPTFDFEDADTPDITDEIQEITFTGTWTAGSEYRLTVGNDVSGILSYGATVQEQIDEIRQGLLGLASMSAGGAADIVVTNTSPGGTEPKGPYRVLFTGALGNKDWPDIVAGVRKNDGGGLIAVDPDIIQGASGAEPVWSATRGWPRSVTFHESRLFLGGTPQLPATIWGSKSDDPFDFDIGKALDDDAIEAAMTADRLDAVTDVVSLRNFVTLTSGGEYYSADAPITPRNVGFRRDTARGVAAVRVVVLDGSIVFVQRDRASIRQMVFTDAENAYIADDLTILSRHMLVTPTDMDVQQSTLGDYVHVVQSNGTMLVLNVNRAHGVFAWTRYTTRSGDKFVSVAALPDAIQLQRVWVCVERIIGGVTKYFLERFDNGRLLDCSRTVGGVDATTWGGLSHLEGETVWCLLDGLYDFEAVVTGGSVTSPAPGTNLQVGFHSAIPVVETMPVAIETVAGRLSLRRKRILRATVDVMDSADVWVGHGDEDGQRVDSAHWGFDVPPLLNGPFECRLLGWRAQPNVKVTQRLPRAFALRGIEQEVEVQG